MAFFGRGKNKVQSPYTFQDMYIEYLKDVDENSPYFIPYCKFVEICSHYYKGMMDYVFEGGIFIMPFSLGSISIFKKKPKKLIAGHLQIDWENSVKCGKRVYHLNDHSNYYKFRFYWSKQNTRLANKGMYSMVFTRENKRRLASEIKSGNTNYFEL